MSTRDKLLARIDAFLKANGIAASAFGTMAIKDSSFVLRLRAGRNIRIGTMERVEEFMRTYAPPAPPGEEAGDGLKGRAKPRRAATAKAKRIPSRRAAAALARAA